jgi:hypothetical protein
MGSKTIRLEEDVYEMLAERKREDETFSPAVSISVGEGNHSEPVIYRHVPARNLRTSTEWAIPLRWTTSDVYEGGLCSLG